MLKVVADETARTELAASLDEIGREGARRMLAVALEAEADAYIEALTDEVDEDGYRILRGFTLVSNGWSSHNGRGECLVPRGAPAGSQTIW